MTRIFRIACTNPAETEGCDGQRPYRLDSEGDVISIDVCPVCGYDDLTDKDYELIKDNNIESHDALRSYEHDK